MEKNPAYQNILDDLASWLEYEIAEGRGRDGVPEDLVRGLSVARPSLRYPAPADPGPAVSDTLLRTAVRPAAVPPRRSAVPVPSAAPVRAVPAAPSAPHSFLPPDQVGRELQAIAGQIAGCTRCILAKGRKKTVPGQGHLNPEILFVGEGPGAEEDEQGLAFVGAAGQLLTRMIQAMGLTRDEVFIANVVKCRPPGNRPPEPVEMEACLPYLRSQIQVLRPKVIVTLGATALRGLLAVSEGITRVRGHWMQYEGIDLMPTFHPSYLLRYSPAKKDAWEDLQAVLRKLGRTPPPVPNRR